MTFTLSGGDIIQTGTDNSLSGLSSITGVTVLSTGTGEQADNTYDIASLDLIIQGTLNIDVYTERIVCQGGGSANLVVDNGGTLNVNGSRVINGVTKFSSRCWFKHQNVSSQFDDYGIQVRNNGTLNWTGGEAEVPRSVIFEPSSTVTLNNAIIDTVRLDTSGNAESGSQIIQESTSLNIDTFILKRGKFKIVATPATLLNYKPEHCTDAFAFSGGTPNEDIHISGYNASDASNEKDVSLFRGCRPVFTNSVNGTDLRAGRNSSTNASATNYGFIVFRQEFNPVIRDTSGTAVVGASIYMRDTDNGGRTTYTSENYLTSAGLQVDPDQDFTYSGTTGTGGNLAAPLLVYTGFIAVNEADGLNVPAIAGTGNTVPDYRSKSNTSADDFDLKVASYAHLLASSEVVLKGSSVVTTGAILVDDPLITEAVKSTVDAYTEIDTAAKFYDRAKSYLVDNFSGEDNPIVTRERTAIDAGGYDVVVDATAAAVFAYDGSTITIKATTFADSITTTGTVTTANGASITGIVSDANGSTGVLTLS